MSQSSLDSTSSALTLTPTTPEVLHFAYASSSSALLSISSAALPVGLAYLPGFTLTLSSSGRANVVPVQERRDSPSLLAVPGQEDAKGKEVEGAEVTKEEGVYGLMYLLPEEDERRLDEAQGGYQKTIQEVELFPADLPEIEADTVSVRVVRALVYYDTEAGEPGTPEKEHAKEVKDAVAEAVEWGMPAWYVERVRRFIPLDEAEVEDTKGKGKEKGKEKA